MSATIVRYVEVEVVVTVNDPAVISRCVDNEDNWRGSFYDISTEDEVIDHMIYNCVSNGVRDASQLDGWADLAPGCCTMSIESVGA